VGGAFFVAVKCEAARTSEAAEAAALGLVNAAALGPAQSGILWDSKIKEFKSC